MPPNIMISGVHITVWDLDPKSKTPPAIHVYTHYKRFMEKSLVTRHFNLGVLEPENTSSVQKMVKFESLEKLFIDNCQEISQESYKISPFKQHKHLSQAFVCGTQP